MKNFVGRALKRDKTRLRAKIDCMEQKTHGAVLDLSQHGICLYLAIDIPVGRGDKITVETEEIGLLVGTVRWIRRPRVGAELVLTSNNRAKVESYYRLFRPGHPTPATLADAAGGQASPQHGRTIARLPSLT